MKRPSLLIAFFVLVVLSSAAADVTDPPWEAASAAIQRRMALERSVVTVKDSANHLSYRGSTFAGQPVQSWRYTLATGGRSPQLALRFAASNDGFGVLHHLFTQAHGSPDEFHGDTRRDALWTLGSSEVSAGQIRRILLTNLASGRDQRVELTFFNTPAPVGDFHSEIHYTLRRDPHPTAAQLDAYRRITDAMDGAIRFYDQFTVGIVKNDSVFLDPGEATAEGNVNGNIQFGPADISLRTALHEMSHTVGIGTTPEFHRLTVNERFVGKHALAQLRAITGDDHAILHADTWHFWPYGLNNPGEDHSIWDYIYHCQMVSAIMQDCRELR